MKVIFVAALTVTACVLLLMKRSYKRQILVAYFCIIAAFSVYYNIKLLPAMPDISFNRPFMQTFYQKAFLNTGEFPDSLLPLILKGKTVYTKNDPMDFEEADAMGKNWLYGYYHVKNAVNYLKLVRAKVECDEGMNGTMVTDLQIREDFHRLGPSNDMFRYSFVCNDFWEELGNAFTYYWYYSTHLSETEVFINIGTDKNGEDINTSKELVMLWDSPMGPKEEENIYIMTKAYYEEMVRPENEESLR